MLKLETLGSNGHGEVDYVQRHHGILMRHLHGHVPASCNGLARHGCTRLMEEALGNRAMPESKQPR
jgi:hypothetical protein